MSEPIKNNIPLELTDGEYKRLADFIKQNYGIYLKEEKRTLLTGRLYKILDKAGYSNFTDYCNFLFQDKSGKALTEFVDNITTNHTYFMRESEHFFYFRDKVLPYLEKAVPNKDLRIWCAACSTGEESYTLAMILDEYFKQTRSVWDCKVLATDISSRVLKDAAEGVYSQTKVESLPLNWKLNYFNRYGDSEYRITDAIKKEVIYRKFNLMEKAFPFKKKFHCIFCRNVMIYFDEETKDRLIEKFYDCTEPGGYLFVGHSESLNREITRYKYIMPAVYRKE
ncbi:MAG: protein-glutamate O-methyltransferase CheR [Oscillospiraceae bacterium]|nr:protein-glutamate O-methyltransferase CheR [Oscillospiraceae bacterium]